MRPKRNLSVALIVLAAALLVGIYGLHRQTASTAVAGSEDRSGEIAAQLGADGCASSGYVLTSKIGQPDASIYNCTVDGTKDICVTEEDGVVNDRTAVARALFASMLSGSKPACVQ